MLPNIEVIVGTYEEFLLGYCLTTKDKEIVLKQTFADKSHTGHIKSLAVQAPWIASGGSDDRIFIYDMRNRKQSQILLPHSGSINALVFSPDLTHLLSGSADGHMIATRVGSWTIEGDWKKAHAGSPVTHICCHHTSKLALSLGGDHILNTWNLVKGRVAYKTNLKNKPTLGSAPECLSWSTEGQYFTLSGPLVLEIWQIKSANVLRRVKMPAKPICVTWVSDDDVLTGLENGSIAWTSLNTPKEDEPKIISAHSGRLKAMAYLNETLATVSSTGEMKVWRSDISNRKLVLLATINIDCRPTCVGLLDLSHDDVAPAVEPKAASTKHVEISQEEEEDLLDIEPRERGFVTIEYDENERKPVNDVEDDAGEGTDSSKSVEDDSDENDSELSGDSVVNFSESTDSSSNDKKKLYEKQRKRKQQPLVSSKQQKKNIKQAKQKKLM